MVHGYMFIILAVDTYNQGHRPSIYLLPVCVWSVQVLGTVRANNFYSYKYHPNIHQIWHLTVAKRSRIQLHKGS